jgi:hypothetical protein
MTKKHFESIAAILARHKTWAPLGRSAKPVRGAIVGSLARDLADYFATENPRFDRYRFLRACGVES